MQANEDNGTRAIMYLQKADGVSTMTVGLAHFIWQGLTQEEKEQTIADYEAAKEKGDHAGQ